MEPAYSKRLDDADYDPDDSSGGPLGRDEFIALFDRYFAPLVRFARQFTNDTATAGDVVQDVFLKLWERRETLKIRTSAQTMLYTMVRNRSLNLRRDRKKLAGDVSAEEAFNDLSAVDPESENELREQVHEWIKELPDRRREAFMLSRYHDLSHSEIAEVMDLSVRTVDTHILLALRSLRARLDAYRQEGRLDS